MHCNRKDVARWKKYSALRKRNEKLAADKKNWIKSTQLGPDPTKPKTIRVIKLDGTVQIIEKK